MTIDLDAMENAAKAATQGPWTVIPPEPYDGDEPELEGSFVYPGGIEDADGNAVCAFGWAGGSGHMFEAPGNPPYLAAWNPATALSVLARLRTAEAEVERQHDIVTGAAMHAKTQAETIKSLSEALHPFAAEGRQWLPLWPNDHVPICAPWGSLDGDSPDEAEDRASFSVGDLRNAVHVLNKARPDTGSAGGEG